jgi:hypothetical protein
VRRYRLRLRPVCRVGSIAIWWDPTGRHYVCALTQPGGQVRHESYERLRDAIYWQKVNAVFDDRVLRALLKDRAATTTGPRS